MRELPRDGSIENVEYGHFYGKRGPREQSLQRDQR